MFSNELQAWLRNFSQSAAVDMCMGGDDAECVAETCLTCVSVHDMKLEREVQAAIAAHGYGLVIKEAMKHVCTL
jgi:hypothetical protein